jgi:hypothetical protein
MLNLPLWGLRHIREHNLCAPGHFPPRGLVFCTLMESQTLLADMDDAMGEQKVPRKQKQDLETGVWKQ